VIIGLVAHKIGFGPWPCGWYVYGAGLRGNDHQNREAIHGPSRALETKDPVSDALIVLGGVSVNTKTKCETETESLNPQQFPRRIWLITFAGWMFDFYDLVLFSFRQRDLAQISPDAAVE
jgi:hypothetical protein